MDKVEAWYEMSKEPDVWGNSEYVFNPDQLRKQTKLHGKWSDSVRAKIESLLRREGLFSPSHSVTDVVALKSFPGCMRQPWHYDYDPAHFKGATVACRPLGVLIALQDGTRFHVRLPSGEEVEVLLGKGDVLVFDGGLLHAGAAYESENVRLHAYIDVSCLKRRKNMTWLVEPSCDKKIVH